MESINLKVEVLLELILCVDINEEENNILKQTLPFYLRKLNCFMAGVYKYRYDKTLKEKHLLPMTFKSDETWGEINSYLKQISSDQSDTFGELNLDNKFYYFYKLDKYGYLILGRYEAFNVVLKNELQIVISHLGKILFQSVIEKQRKISEEKLANERKLLQTIIDNIPICIYTKDKQFKKTLVNKAEINFYQKNSEAELLGKTDFDFLDEKDAYATLAEDKLVLEKGLSFINVEKQVNPNQWAYISKLPLLDTKGEISGILGLLLDVSEKKKQELELLKFSMAVEQSPVAIVITNLKGKIEYVNEAFCNISGYCNNELINRHIRILYNKKIKDTTLNNMLENVRKGILWQNELIIKKKNNKYLWTDFFITPIVDEDGKIINFLSFANDISEKKKYESNLKKLNLNLEKKVRERTLELEKARLEAEAANKAKSEFLSRMSHELRTPMNSILGFAQLIEMNEENETHKKGIKHILNNGKYLLDLINEVLDLSKIESGTLEVISEDITVRPLISELVELINPMAKTRGIQIDYNATVENLKFRSDKQRLKQILLNLMNNAIKYNKENGNVIISIYPRQTKGTKQQIVHFSIADTGIGISKQNRQKLFQPFERIDADKTGIEGTGLGLSVVKKLVELLGGEIGVESETGIGSDFWFEIPVKETISMPSENNAFENPDEIHADKSGGLILYIEDNVSNLELVQTIIEMTRPGIKIINSVYGRNTVSMAKMYCPELILLDLNLPDIKGIDVLDELQKDTDTKDIPVIVVSADAMSYRITELLNHGAKAYISKPININDFLKTLDQWL